MAVTQSGTAQTQRDQSRLVMSNGAMKTSRVSSGATFTTT